MTDSTDILIIMDRSGSMQDAKADYEGGLRSFVESQAQMPGDVRLTLVQFDTTNPCEVVYDRAPLDDVKAITLVPRGGTPLYDAIGKAIAHLQTRLAADKATPDQIVCVILTDGEENESREWTKAQVKSRVGELEQGNWTVLYLAANVDAFTEAEAIGVSGAAVMDFMPTESGAVSAMFSSTSANVLRARGAVRSAKLAGASSARAAGLAKSYYTYNAFQASASAGDTASQAAVSADLANALKEVTTRKDEDK